MPASPDKAQALWRIRLLHTVIWAVFAGSPRAAIFGLVFGLNWLIFHRFALLLTAAPLAVGVALYLSFFEKPVGARVKTAS